MLISILSRVNLGEKVDIQALFLKFTLDSIGQIAFGYNIGIQVFCFHQIIFYDNACTNCHITGALHQDRVDFADAFDYCQVSHSILFQFSLHSSYSALDQY